MQMVTVRIYLYYILSCTKISVFVLDIPVERETQINSIVKTLQESFEKLKISLILPQIFENHLRLQQRLGDSQYMYCIKLIEEYIRDKVHFWAYNFITKQFIILKNIFRKLAVKIKFCNHI